jgi:MinD superfamily P-loop ATPase
MNKKKAKNIVVCSGKGGVGKSMICSVLAKLFSLSENIVAVDADVDAPNLHLWLGQKENWDEKEKVSLTEKAVVINQPSKKEIAKNIGICQFGALKVVKNKLTVNRFLCEGCGACQAVFVPKTFKIIPVNSGEIRIKKNIHGFPLISAQLYPGQTGSGKIVDELKGKAVFYHSDRVIIDAPAGMGCPVIASVNNADFAVLVTEPTPSGFADLKRIRFLVNHFKVPFGVVINKYDLDENQTAKIEKWAGKEMLGKICYDKNIFKAIGKLVPIFETNLPANKQIKAIHKNILKRLVND